MILNILLSALPLYVFFGKKFLFRSLAHVNWVVFHFIIEFWEFFIYSGYKSFIIYFFAHIFSQSALVFNLNIVQCPSISRNLFVAVVKLLSCVQLFETPWTVACQSLCSWDFPSKSTGVGCHFLLQRIFLIQGSNLGLLHRRRILYHPGHQGSLRLKSTIFLLFGFVSSWVNFNFFSFYYFCFLTHCTWGLPRWNKW